MAEPIRRFRGLNPLMFRNPGGNQPSMFDVVGGAIASQQPGAPLPDGPAVPEQPPQSDNAIMGALDTFRNTPTTPFNAVESIMGPINRGNPIMDSVRRFQNTPTTPFSFTDWAINSRNPIFAEPGQAVQQTPNQFQFVDNVIANTPHPGIFNMAQQAIDNAGPGTPFQAVDMAMQQGNAPLLAAGGSLSAAGGAARPAASGWGNPLGLLTSAAQQIGPALSAAGRQAGQRATVTEGYGPWQRMRAGDDTSPWMQDAPNPAGFTPSSPLSGAGGSTIQNRLMDAMNNWTNQTTMRWSPRDGQYVMAEGPGAVRSIEAMRKLAELEQEDRRQVGETGRSTARDAAAIRAAEIQASGQNAMSPVARAQLYATIKATMPPGLTQAEADRRINAEIDRHIAAATTPAVTGTTPQPPPNSGPQLPTPASPLSAQQPVDWAAELAATNAADPVAAVASIFANRPNMTQAERAALMGAVRNQFTPQTLEPLTRPLSPIESVVRHPALDPTAGMSRWLRGPETREERARNFLRGIQ